MANEFIEKNAAGVPKLYIGTKGGSKQLVGTASKADIKRLGISGEGIFGTAKKAISGLFSDDDDKKKKDQQTVATYMTLGMSIGAGMGIIYGIAVFDNIALGLPIGVGAGMAIGIALGQAKTKKDKAESEE